jgi:hypothetical protein
MSGGGGTAEGERWGNSGEEPPQVGVGGPLATPDREADLRGDCGGRPGWVETRPSSSGRPVSPKAPISAIRGTAIEPPESTHTGHSLAMMPDVYPPIACFRELPAYGTRR